MAGAKATLLAIRARNTIEVNRLQDLHKEVFA